MTTAKDLGIKPIPEIGLREETRFFKHNPRYFYEWLAFTDNLTIVRYSAINNELSVDNKQD
jgi:hypothetical protein